MDGVPGRRGHRPADRMDQADIPRGHPDREPVRQVSAFAAAAITDRHDRRKRRMEAQPPGHFEDRGRANGERSA